MTTRWFLEEIGPLIIVSRFDPETADASFTCDGGATWTDGDRSFDFRWGEDGGMAEITEDQARGRLTAVRS